MSPAPDVDERSWPLAICRCIPETHSPIVTGTPFGDKPTRWSEYGGISGDVFAGIESPKKEPGAIGPRLSLVLVRRFRSYEQPMLLPQLWQR
jgi:hypothetical protein